MEDQQSQSSSNDPFGLRRRTPKTLLKLGENIRRSSSSLLPSIANTLQQHTSPNRIGLRTDPEQAAPSSISSSRRQPSTVEVDADDDNPNSRSTSSTENHHNHMNHNNNVKSRRTAETETDLTAEGVRSAGTNRLRRPLIQQHSPPKMLQHHQHLPLREVATAVAASPQSTLVSQLSNSPGDKDDDVYERVERHRPQHQHHHQLLEEHDDDDEDNQFHRPRTNMPSTSFLQSSLAKSSKTPTSSATAPPHSTTSRSTLATAATSATTTTTTTQLASVTQLQSQLQATRDELRRTNAQYAQLQHEHRTQQQQHLAASSQVTQQQEQVWELQTAVAAAEAACHEKQLRLQSFESELQQQQANWTELAQQRETEWESHVQAETTQLQEEWAALQVRQAAVQATERELEQTRLELEQAVQQVEARNDAYEGKYADMQSKYQDMRQRVQAGQQELQAVEAKRREALQQAERVSADSKRVQEALRDRIQEGELEYDAIEEMCREKKQELDAIKARIKVFVEEDTKCRRQAASDSAAAREQLHAMQGRIQQAQAEQEALKLSLELAKQEIQSQKDRIRAERVEWEEEKRTEIERLRQLELQTREENATLVQQAKEILEEEAAAVKERCAAMERTLDSKTQRLDDFQTCLTRATQMYQRDFRKLKKDQQECDELRDDLNNQMACFASSEGREKRLREELDREYERLRSLVQTQKIELEQKTRDAETAVETINQGHREEMRTLAERLATAESERDALADEVDARFREIERLQAKHVSERDSSRRETEELKAKLADAVEESQRTDAYIVELRQKQAFDGEERAKVKSLMNRLEANSSSLEKRLLEVEAEKTHLEKTKKEYQNRLDALQEKERDVAKQHAAVDVSSGKLARDTRRFQKLALSKLLLKPWRHEQEVVSAAFSKWVRVVFFYRNQQASLESEADREELEQHILRLQNELNKSQEIQKQLERERSSLLERIGQLDQSRGALEMELQSNKREIQNLTKEMNELREDSDGVSHSAGADQSLLRHVARREADLLQRERELRELELTLNDRDRKTFDGLGNTHSRIRKMAESLQRKEAELESKEEQLEAELSKSQATQARLQELTMMLKKKAEQIEKDSLSVLQRMDDCDALEAELKLWQHQLELGKAPQSRDQEETILRQP